MNDRTTTCGTGAPRAPARPAHRTAQAGADTPHRGRRTTETATPHTPTTDGSGR